jgi:protein involved in polysaccharide export with SLBB domain
MFSLIPANTLAHSQAYGGREWVSDAAQKAVVTVKKYILVLFTIGLVVSRSFAADVSMTVNPAGTITPATIPGVQDWTKSLTNTVTISPQTAMATKNYLVTPGDIYTLALGVEADILSYSIPVDNTYKMKILNLAIIDANGLTYTELKAKVDNVMSKNYPMSNYVFSLSTPGHFTVLVKGEVTQTAELNAWGLSRLSQTIASVVTNYSSIRDVQITSGDGTIRHYDLFMALRYGDITQNPYIRPGDTITLSRSKRTVVLSGAVERAGTYQILDGENLRDLVRKYGSGLTQLANPNMTEMTRYIEGGAPAGNTIMLSAKDIESDYELKDFDKVSIPTMTELQPTMFIEGAVGVTAGVTTQASIRKIINFNVGINFADLVRDQSSLFSAVSDTKNAFVIRGEKNIPLDLDRMLYDKSYMSEYTVEPNDLLMVPFKQYFVTVKGAVVAPGRYPFIPCRMAGYYVNLAGGINPELNTLSSMRITDINGKRLKKGEQIPPESTVYVFKNSWLYYFNLYSPVILTTCSLITTYYTTKAVLDANN